MSVFLKAMIDSDGNETIFMFEAGNDTPIRSLSRQDVEILGQSCKYVKNEVVSLKVPALHSNPVFKKVASISYRNPAWRSDKKSDS